MGSSNPTMQMSVVEIEKYEVVVNAKYSGHNIQRISMKVDREINNTESAGKWKYALEREACVLSFCEKDQMNIFTDQLTIDDIERIMTHPFKK